ncbi:hypothetical protein BBJ29_002228 [Phytophthora kernoviae]|uniref:Microsomal glutathione S-transferase 1 n=1 Tax=Phytophthora kernoviae TaxID=325452 RepID=A0A3F2RWX1_9STRA|nr:hypothetical protein BBJ29_002228 [Phytophthora kernoviae]RLN64862.1 hypothetical protein BBP00_00003201 [Phytophthora kernoviae]
MSASTELKTYVTCAAVLYVKFVLATGIQATKTFEAGGRPPEDKNLPLAKGNPVQTYGLVTPPESSKEESEKIQKAKLTELRWRRIVQNDLESIPLALVVFGAGVMAKGNPTVQCGVMVGYTAVRCFHTVAYANAMHPHRALCWLFGIIFITTGAGNALYGAFSSTLYLKFLACTWIQGGKTFRSGSRPPEDMKLNLTKIKQDYGLTQTDDENVLKAREVEHRWRRVIANDLESIPFALFVFGGGILAGSNPVVHTGAMVVYTAARCLHTYVYLNAMQPHRAICWSVGVAATLVGVGNAAFTIL